MIKKCALVGNQNSGKSLLFNVLTGMNQKVGNWPGVTVERKDGVIKGTDITITDLPGIYSLSPYTSEERVSYDFIKGSNLDLIINIVDSTSIERALYLTTQLQELGIKMLLVLNMEDILEKKGYKIDSRGLSKALGITIVSISALKKTGIKELIDVIQNDKILDYKENKIYSPNVEALVEEIKLNNDDHTRFAGVKVIERDDRFYNQYTRDLYEDKIKSLETNYKVDTEELFAKERYDYIEKLRDKYIVKIPKTSITDKIDKIVLNKYLALPIFIIVMLLVYLLSVGFVGGATVGIVDGLFNGMDSIEFALPFMEPVVVELGHPVMGLGPWLAELITNAGGSQWAASLVADGVVAGIGAVLNFLPQLLILFLLLSLLETVGYMSRVTFLFDRAFRKIGMSGKSLIPFIVGSGCSVPGIMAARQIENESEHDITVMLTPFIPCSAKLPILTCFIGGIFMPIMGGASWLITFLFYFMSIIIIIAVGYIMNKFFIKNKQTSYVSELPEYHAPSASYIFKDVLDKGLSFIKRAGTVIFLSSIVIWVLLNLNYKFQFVGYLENGNLNIEESLLAQIGKTFAFIFAPMLGLNFSWGAAVSAIQGLVAKEAVVSSLEVIASVAEGGNIFNSEIFGFFNGFSAFGYMTFVLFSAPCFGAIAAMKREFGSSKKMWKAVLIQTAIAYTLASLIGIWGAFI